MIKLFAIGLEGFVSVEDLFEDSLNINDVPSDSDGSAKIFFQVRGRAEMVSVGMGLQNPVNV